MSYVKTMLPRPNFKLSFTSPAYIYNVEKNIQNTIRVPSSLYTMHLGVSNSSNSSIQWNQMSDRILPHTQPNVIYNNSNSTKFTTTKLRPGALSPGGTGVDVKHNSYNRYLNKLKGKGHLKHGNIPSNYGINNSKLNGYTGKSIKTTIGNNSCYCKNGNYITNKQTLYTDTLPLKLNVALYGEGYGETTDCVCQPYIQTYVTNNIYGYSNTNSTLLQCQLTNNESIYVL